MQFLKFHLILKNAFLNWQKRHLNTNQIYFVTKNNETSDIIEEIQHRFEFYCPSKQLIKTTACKSFFSLHPIIVIGETTLISKTIDKYRYGIFNVDYRTNPTDGWVWCKLASLCSNYQRILEHTHTNCIKKFKELSKIKYSRTYIFGTGPSLSLAKNREWDDGFRVVCNTIVKNQKLWKHINPHIIVAGDTIYHFGHNLYAKSFRRDLLLRLSETNTLFIYPDIFDAIVQREFSMFADRLIPIPCGYHKSIHTQFKDHFALPLAENVLVLLLLPVACNLSKEIYLWGFDGRAPTDELFWKNSITESYPEYLNELKKCHPAFFNYHIPEDNPSKYVNEVHGDILEKCLKNAEKDGYQFIMMHDTYTPNLSKRRQVRK